MATANSTRSFTITAAAGSLKLDPQAKGSCTFTVTSSAATEIGGRVRLSPTGGNPAGAEWLKLVEKPEQRYKPNESRAFTVTVAAPADTKDGTYLFRPEAYAVENPNEDFIYGPEIGVVVKQGVPAAPAKKSFPLWIPIVIVLAVLAIGGTVAAVLMTHKSADASATVAVPELVGKPRAEAEKALADAHFALGAVTEQEDAKHEAGTVLAQDPAGDSSAAAGATVALTVAAGASTTTGTTATGPATVKVPDVVGKTVAEATRALTAAGLREGAVREDATASGADGSVVKEEPSANAAVAHGTAVALVVKARLIPAPPAPATPPTVAWQGTFTVRQTFMGDIDAGKELESSARQDADFWFEADNATARFLQAENGAKFALVHEATLAECEAAIAHGPLERIAVANLTPAVLVAVHTRLGRYAVIALEQEVGPSPGRMVVRFLRFSTVRPAPPKETLERVHAAGKAVSP